VLGKIIQGAPVSATQIRTSIPVNVDAAIRKALEKLPADRFTGAQDFAKALADEGFRHGELVGSAARGAQGQWNRLSVGMTALAAGFALAFGWALLRPEAPQPVERFTLGIESQDQPGVSPDGSAVVFVSDDTDGVAQVWLRRWGILEPAPIPGTEGSNRWMTPVISPAGDEVAFVADGQLKVAPAGWGCCSDVGRLRSVLFALGA
jgi:serine/threonine-protein kinase